MDLKVFDELQNAMRIIYKALSVKGLRKDLIHQWTTSRLLALQEKGALGAISG
jgi:hypothetical protein